MSKLGTIYKIVYVAKNNKSGLVGVSAKVLSPDLTLFKNVALSEIQVSGFSGSYSGDLITEQSDQEGDYIVSIEEPGGHKSHLRVPLSNDTGQIVIGDIGVIRVQAFEANITLDKEILASIESSKFDAVYSKSSYDAYFYKDDLEYFLDNNELIGELS